MPVQLKVNKGSVKWFPTGSERDAPSRILHEGDSVEMKSALDPKTNFAQLEVDRDKLRDFWKKQVERDKAAPAVGSAGKDGPGEVIIETDLAPVLARLYEGSTWTEIIVLRDSPLTASTTQTNAVTVALYGVVAVDK